MKLSELRQSASLLECKVKTNGDMDLMGGKLYAFYCQDTGKRVTPFLSLAEWSKVNEAKIMLDYLKTAN
jgi:hypothetical protein